MQVIYVMLWFLHKTINSFKRIKKSLESHEPPEGVFVPHLAGPARQTVRFAMPQRRHVRKPDNNPSVFTIICLTVQNLTENAIVAIVLVCNQHVIKVATQQNSSTCNGFRFFFYFHLFFNV